MECAVLDIHKLVGKKWTILILQELYHNDMTSFNNLKIRLKNPTNRILSRRLKELGKHSLVERKIIQKNPLSVVYALTKKGKDLTDVFNKAKSWGIKYGLTSGNCINKNCNDCKHADYLFSK